MHSQHTFSYFVIVHLHQFYPSDVCLVNSNYFMNLSHTQIFTQSIRCEPIVQTSYIPGLNLFSGVLATIIPIILRTSCILVNVRQMHVHIRIKQFLSKSTHKKKKRRFVKPWNPFDLSLKSGSVKIKMSRSGQI